MDKNYPSLFLEIQDLNNNTKITEQISEPTVTYYFVVDLIESYSPQIDNQVMTLYYDSNGRGNWELFLEDDKIDMKEKYYEYDPQTNRNTLKVKYHCQYFVEDNDEWIIQQNINEMHSKIQNVQHLYQNIKEQYIQEALDINIFWGCPSWTRDMIKRSHRAMQTMINTKGQEIQLLNNQVKYWPYVSAVNRVLQNCNKKVHLYLKPLNADSFKRKSVFTVTYIIAHVEMEEIKGGRESKREGTQFHLQQMKSSMANLSENKQGLFTTVQRLNSELMQPPPAFERGFSEILPPFRPPIFSNQSTHNINSSFALSQGKMTSLIQQPEQIDMIPLSPVKSQQKSSSGDQSIRLEYSKSIDMNEVSFQLKTEPFNYPEVIQELTQQKSSQTFSKKKSEDKKSKQSHPQKKTKKFVYNLWGQWSNGQLCKISPDRLDKMITNHRETELLILQTSFPDQHLKILRKKAKNIILINSNPLYPESNTIFFVQQLFTFLLKNGNISEAFNQARFMTQRFKSQQFLNKVPSEQKQFIRRITEKYVHGGLSTCCCYHHHNKNCVFQNNQNPSKYAQHHYRCHYVINCDCNPQKLMWHHCDKKKIMKKQYNVLDNTYKEKDFYFCCCLGHEMGYYKYQKKNITFNDIQLIKEKDDPHSLQNKFVLIKGENQFQSNKLEIYDGKLMGDCHQALFDAFKFREQNSLIGNVQVTINLLQIFTSCLKDITVCNIYGKKRSGRKTIAVHWSKIAIIKQFYQRVINIKVTVDNISQVIKKQYEKNKGQGMVLLVLIFADQGYGQCLDLHEGMFDFKLGHRIHAIIISQQKIRISGDNIEVHYLQPQPFKVQNCLAYIKMYKHLTRAGKKNLEALFQFVKNKSTIKPIQAPELYPCSLNEFEILNIIHKTDFEHEKYSNNKPDYRVYALALTKIRYQYIPFYIFVMSIIKFTKSYNGEQVLEGLQNELISMKQRKVLFFRDYREKMNERQIKNLRLSCQSQQQYHQQGQKISKNHLSQSLINFRHLKNHYFLMYLFLAEHLKPKAISILKLFINFSSVSPIQHKFSHHHKESMTLRTKIGQYQQQVYEATTLNNASYLSKYFKNDLDRLLKQFQQQPKKDIRQVQQLLKSHAILLQNKRISNKKSFSDTYPKTSKKGSDGHHSVNVKQAQDHIFNESDMKEEDATDIPHIKHLAAVIQAGLQYMRMIVSTHFIYNRFQSSQKIDIMKLGLLLLNNCIILMKNKTFTKISGNFDLDEEYNDGFNYSRKAFQHSGNIVPDFIPTMRSEAQQRDLPTHTIRNYSSGKQLFQSRQIKDGSEKIIDLRHKFSDREDRFLKSDKHNSDLLIKQLYRLSTYKGLLYLLSQLERRCDELSNQNISQKQFETTVKLKISIQLLGIQVRLEQSHLLNCQVKIDCSIKDRHLCRLNQVFNEKNYNILTLKRIVREQVSRNKYNVQNEEISLIKAHIIVALSLMSSGYGRYKLAGDSFMIEDIQNFLRDWNYEVPTILRKDESQTQVSQSQNQYIIKPSPNSTIFEFMRFICQNQSIYYRIVTSFNSVAIWQTPHHNSEVQLYQDMLRLYHLFLLRNTKSKCDFYQKLQMIEYKLKFFKRQKDFNNRSTYLHNFYNTFLNLVKNQMHKLEQHLVLTLTAESQTVQNDVRMSIGQRIDNVLENNTTLFSIRKKFSRNNIHNLVNHHKCYYLIIYASTNKNNEKEIWMETQNTRKSYPRQLICQQLSKVKFKVAFICLPKKANLAEILIEKNPRKRIVYFDFSHDSFIFANQKFRRDQNLFQKMIMIKTVSDIMRNILTLQREGCKTFLSDSYARARKSLSFELRQDNNSEMIILKNENFKKCVFMHGIQSNVAISDVELPSKELKAVILRYNQRITKNHLQIINKFMKVLYRVGDSRIDISEEKKQFLKVFAFYFKQRLDYQYVLQINMEELKGGNRRDDRIIIKNFYKKIIELKLFDYVYSNKKVILILQLRQQDSKLKDLLDNTIYNALQGYSDKDREGRRHKFQCVHKNHIQALIYFFEYGSKQLNKYEIFN